MVAAPDVLLVVPELGVVVDGEDEPHAARRRAATLDAAATLTDILNAYLLDEGSNRLPHGRRLKPTSPSRLGRYDSPHGIARRVALPGPERKEVADVQVRLMPN